MTASLLKMRCHVLGAVMAGLSLRLFFIWVLPSSGWGDSPIYEELARNWLDHGVYGLHRAGRLFPVDIRLPGYPAFLAGVYAIFGRRTPAVMLAQAALDVATCFLVAALAAWLAPEESRRRTAIAALWLASLCPFTANYTATVLAEVPAVFFTALALVVLLFPGAIIDLPAHDSYHQVLETSFLGAFVVGLGTLVRPETPLILASVGLVLVARCRRPENWSKLARCGILMAAGLLVPLLPWAARNWRTLREIQFLAPFYGQMPGEYVPRGFYAWTGTWLWRFGDVYQFPWKLDEEPIRIEDVPAAASDSPGERARIERLLERYNQTTTMSSAVDRGFAEIARERTARRPLRTYLAVPIKRVAAIWVTPRIEMLPFSGRLWPIREAWEEDPVDFLTTAGLGLLGFFYVSLGILGAWIARRDPATSFLAAFVLVRTAFLTTVPAPEPRYVLECFPAVLALGAQLWRRGKASPAPSD